jgi:SAM-dependent methyltransferase
MASIVDERGYNQMFRRTPAQLLRLKRRAEAMVTEMALPALSSARSNIRIIELGCGSGELAHELAVQTGSRVTGTDLSARFIGEARASFQHFGLDFIVADLTKEMPSVDARAYDYIVGNGILHHLFHHLDSILPQLRRWLLPGGRIIFWEPNLRNPYIYSIFTFPRLRKWAKLEPDEMAFSSRWISDGLVAAGFTDIKVEPRDFLLPNTPTLLVPAVIKIGGVVENIPLLKQVSQSLFISARNG